MGCADGAAQSIEQGEDTMKISRYDNAQVSVQGTTMTITVNLDEEQVDVRPSASGKTMVVATTGGAKKINGVSVNLTVYRK